MFIYIYKDRARYVERKSERERERERDVAYTGNHYLSYVYTPR